MMSFHYVTPDELAAELEANEKLCVLDLRSAVEYNTSHIIGAVNIGIDRAFRQKVLKNQGIFGQLLLKIANISDFELLHIIIYDSSSLDAASAFDDFIVRIWEMASAISPHTRILSGGFVDFRFRFGKFCWDNETKLPGEDFAAKDLTTCNLLALLQDCLDEREAGSVTKRPSGLLKTINRGEHFIKHGENSAPSRCAEIAASTDTALCVGGAKRPDKSPHGPLQQFPSEILPHVLLGCEEDALSADLCAKYGITHVLNVSRDGPASPHVPPANFLRVPINDNYDDDLISHLDASCAFLERVKEENGRVLIHCFAGISRSPSLAVAYLMKCYQQPMTQAYELVKQCRLGVSPNFNFLGQLQKLDQSLRGGDGEGKAVGTKVPNLLVSNATAQSPTPSTSKKRERPSYLGLQAVPRASASSGAQPDEMSPSEGKRSRLANPMCSPRGAAANPLPSPCTHFSSLGLNSPAEERRPAFPGGAQTAAAEQAAVSPSAGRPQRPASLFSKPATRRTSAVQRPKLLRLPGARTPQSPPACSPLSEHSQRSLTVVLSDGGTSVHRVPSDPALRESSAASIDQKATCSSLEDISAEAEETCGQQNRKSSNSSSIASPSGNSNNSLLNTVT